jgi:hypothetical protein
MVFETHSMKNATPATVSRAGILYVNNTDVGYAPYTQRYMFVSFTSFFIFFFLLCVLFHHIYMYIILTYRFIGTFIGSLQLVVEANR